MISERKVCEKKLKTAEIKLNKIIKKIESLKLNNCYVSRLDVKSHPSWCPTIVTVSLKKYIAISVIIIIFVGFWWNVEPFGRRCLLSLPLDTKSLFRSPEDCSMCVGVDDVTRISNTSAEDFEDKFAYTTRPVIVTDATDNWRAIEKFSFNFFYNFYRNNKMGRKINDCFYFAYKSGLNSLDDVFNMDESRANLSGDPWYVGWSTCYEQETRSLREYYNRPYFLPRTAESDMVDWIFMGGPGQGAHMHKMYSTRHASWSVWFGSLIIQVDSVRHMSWQAQVRGRKEWQLAPPPECLYSCSWITFTVEPGEILVVDTNRWYHKTHVLPGDISITIGAEYD